MKKVLSIIMSMFTLLMILPLNSNVVCAVTNEGLSYEAAVAYKNVIDDSFEKYGEFANQGLNGVGLARLIDFNGNGTSELLIACSHQVEEEQFFYEVYGYDDDNGLLRLTHTNARNSMNLVYDMHLYKS